MGETKAPTIPRHHLDMHCTRNNHTIRTLSRERDCTCILVCCLNIEKKARPDKLYVYDKRGYSCWRLHDSIFFHKYSQICGIFHAAPHNLSLDVQSHHNALLRISIMEDQATDCGNQDMTLSRSKMISKHRKKHHS